MATRTERRPLEAGAVHIPIRRVNPLRAVHVVWSIAWHVARAVVRDRGRSPRRAAVAAVGQAFTDLGPTFIKLGQMISANPAIFPQFIIEAFAHNQDRCRPERFDVVERTIHEDLGGPIAEIFHEFDRVPLASGSIAQVHRAVLRDGTVVAVKVQRPRLVELLGQDLALMEVMAKALVRLRPRYAVTNPVGAVHDFRITLGEELAFLVEARRMDELRTVFDAWPVVIPRVVAEHTTDRVLTMEFVDGIKINRVAELHAAGHDLRHFADLLISSLLYSALQRGIFHGDGHPGNLVALDGGRLGMYDFGIVGRIVDEDRRQISRFFRGLILERFDVMAQSLTTLADLSAANLEGAMADLQDMNAQLMGPDGQFRLAEIDHTQILTSFLSIANRHGLIIPTDLILLFKQLLYLNGLANLLDPGLDVFEGDRFFAHFAQDDGMAEPQSA